MAQLSPMLYKRYRFLTPPEILDTSMAKTGTVVQQIAYSMISGDNGDAYTFLIGSSSES
jgi:hypothetical protein